MKQLILLLTSMSFVLMAEPILADDRSDRRIGGVKSSEKYNRSARRDARGNRGNREAQRRANRQDRRGNNSNRFRTERQRDARQQRHYRQQRQVRNQRQFRQQRNFRHNNRLYGNNRFYGNRHFRNNGFVYHNGFRYNRFHPRFRHHRFYRNNGTGLFFGGLAVGSALANLGHTHHTHPYFNDHASRVVTTRVIHEGTYARRDDVHFFRDRDGYCFEVTQNRYGDEVRTEIDPIYCEW